MKPFKYLAHNVVVLDPDYRYFAIQYFGLTRWTVFDRQTERYTIQYKDIYSVLNAFENDTVKFEKKDT